MVKSNWQQEEHPVPFIDLDRCDGCGLCVRACPSGALAIHMCRAVIARQEACDFAGLCAMVCPREAIQLPLEIVVFDTTNDLKQDENRQKSRTAAHKGDKMISYNLNPIQGVQT